uniref:Uncharacterized protein n=1 Tax=Anguilla anguilla TaxID=7936 RepID=A0A0E9W720_ANGAN
MLDGILLRCAFKVQFITVERALIDKLNQYRDISC